MSDSEPRAFFSYSRNDSPFVTRSAADLKAAGVNARLDTRDIAPGHEWDRAIEAALAEIPRMILILSPSSADSRNVRDEISFAIDSGKPFIHGGYLIRVSLRGVAASVWAVLTFRDRVLPPPTGNAATADRYVTLAEFTASEFFRSFHIQQVNVDQLDHGEQLVRYMTGAYQDKIFLSLRLEPAQRVTDAVIGVDRDWLGALGRFNPLANDVVMSFIGAVTPNASAGASSH